MSSKDFAIGVLSVTAVILLTGLVIVQAVLPPQAMAFGQSAAGRNYLVTTSQLDEATELLLILDTAAQRLNVYLFNLQLGQVELLQPPIPVDKLGEPDRRGPGPPNR